MTKKQTITKELDSIDASNLDDNLANIIVKITSIFEEYKYKGYTNLRFEKRETSDGYGGMYDEKTISYVLHGDREETDAEVQNRIEQDRKRLETQKKRDEKAKEKQRILKKKREEKEFKEFQRLQAKFEKQRNESQK